MYLVLGLIPPLLKSNGTRFIDLEPFFLIAESPNQLPRTKFYIDNIFIGIPDFNNAYYFLE
jgi:hypothetical protein